MKPVCYWQTPDKQVSSVVVYSEPEIHLRVEPRAFKLNTTLWMAMIIISLSDEIRNEVYYGKPAVVDNPKC